MSNGSPNAKSGPAHPAGAAGRPRGAGRFLKTPFARIAFWQFMVFFMLLLLIWAFRLFDLSGVFGEYLPIPVQYYEPYLLSLGVVLVAVITVGHTHLQQQHTLRGFLKICSACRKVQVNEEDWERIEEYLAGHSLAEVSHGLCPTCADLEIARLKGNRPAAAQPDAGAARAAPSRPGREANP